MANFCKTSGIFALAMPVSLRDRQSREAGGRKQAETEVGIRISPGVSDSRNYHFLISRDMLDSSHGIALPDASRPFACEASRADALAFVLVSFRSWDVFDANV